MKLFVPSDVIESPDQNLHKPQVVKFRAPIDPCVPDSRWQQYVTEPPCEEIRTVITLAPGGELDDCVRTNDTFRSAGVKVGDLINSMLCCYVRITKEGRREEVSVREWLGRREATDGSENAVQSMIMGLEDVNLWDSIYG